MYIQEKQLLELYEQYGTPDGIRLEWNISQRERDIIVASQRKYPRQHDFTLFIFNSRNELSMIQKPSYPKEAYRPMSGAVMPGERLVDGILREAKEETGLDARLGRFVLTVEVDFHCEGEILPWKSHILSAYAEGEHVPEDTYEIADAKWGSLEELQGKIRQLFLDTGRPLMHYRVRLHDEVAKRL
jgi:8-oxo-dGTP pyrophosphatase MutT (NUDIX family)